MKTETLVAKAQISIKAPIEKVWDALVNPYQIKKYMFGATVSADWEVGGKITWSGEWEGKTYEDKGEILQLVPEARLQYSHFSPISGVEDLPENYHVVTVEISQQDDSTFITLTQDNNENEEALKHSSENWELMLKEMKNLLEGD